MATLAEELRTILEGVRQKRADDAAQKRADDIAQHAAYVIKGIPDRLRAAAKRGDNSVDVYQFGDNSYHDPEFTGFAGDVPSPSALTGAAKTIYEWILTQPGLTPYFENGPLCFREDEVPPDRFSIYVRF